VLELVAREKGEANAAAMGTLVAAIKAAGGVVAKFDDDSVAGSAVAQVRGRSSRSCPASGFCSLAQAAPHPRPRPRPTLPPPLPQAWVDDLAAAGVTTVDGTRGLDEALAVKDVAGVEQVTKAGHLTARVGRAVWLKAMERAIESGADVTNASLATEVAESLDNLKAAGVKVDTDSFDWLQAPVVQSGGSYGAVLSRAGARSSDARFSADVVLFSQALKYKSHAAFLARTYLIDPTPSQTRAYDALVRAHDALVEKLRPGVTVREAHAAAVAVFIDAKLPEAAKLPKTFGSGFGLRASEKHLVISGKNGAVVEAGMVFNVCVGLSELPLSDPPRGAKAADAAMAKLKSYALLLANTVVVTASGTEVVTDKLPSDRAQIVFSLAGGDEDEDDEEEEEEDEDAGGRAAARAKAKAKAAAAAAAAPARSTRLAARKQEVDENMEAAARRDEHQKELFASKKAAALRRLAGDDDSGAGGGSARDDAEEVRTAPDIAAYGSTADFPRSGLRPCQISVDKAHSAVLLPVFGSLVPFHVSTIKSAVKSEEGAKALLRINFYAPGQAPGKECAASMQAAMLRHPSAIFVRTLSYMSKEHRNMANVVALIKSMQKTIKVEREAAAQRAGLQEQPKLRLTTDAKFPRLMDLNMWPAISGRKTTGAIEAHTNGLRFLSSKGERVEIIYANVRHGIFQPCEKEHVVLVHFHLKHAIMIGKKKYKDIQFFTEVVEASQAIDGRHRSDYDADEIGEEDRERKMRQEMNKAFKKFCERVEQVAEKDPASAWNKFDVPQRELSFPGAPQREMVTLLPCSDCIVSLVDKPPFVVSLADVEHVHFERVTFTNKDFDLVFVFKEGVRDKGEDEFVRIASIPMRGHLDPIKTWLDEIADMTYTCVARRQPLARARAPQLRSAAGLSLSLSLSRPPPLPPLLFVAARASTTSTGSRSSKTSCGSPTFGSRPTPTRARKSRRAGTFCATRKRRRTRTTTTTRRAKSTPRRTTTTRTTTRASATSKTRTKTRPTTTTTTTARAGRRWKRRPKRRCV